MKIKIDFTKEFDGWEKDSASIFRLYISNDIFTACKTRDVQIEFCEIDDCYCEIDGCEDELVLAEIAEVVTRGKKALTKANR